MFAGGYICKKKTYIFLFKNLFQGLTFVYWCIRHIVYTYIGGLLFGYIVILAKPFTF